MNRFDRISMVRDLLPNPALVRTGRLRRPASQRCRSAEAHWAKERPTDFPVVSCVGTNGMFTRLLAAAVLLWLAWFGVQPSVFAETYPSRPIKLIVGQAPGSALDLRARQISERLGKSLGASFIVENRPGAGGTLGAAAAAKASPDGYTLLYAGAAELSAAPSLYPQLPYDPRKDFTPIGQALRGSAILLASPGSGIKSVEDLISRAKSNPGKITAGSHGNGTNPHLVLLEFMTEAGVDFVHVPYKNASQALLDLIGGQIDVMFDFAISATQHIQTGRLVPLMVVGDSRLSVLPDVRSAKEVGYSGVNLLVWNGLLAPRGTPKVIVDRLSREFIAVMRSPEMQRMVAESGSQLVASTPEEFARQIERDLLRIRDVVKTTGARLD